VFFGGLSYASNLSATKALFGLDPVNPDTPTIGRVNPGNSVGFQLGLALGLNPDASVSVGWSQRFNARTTLDGTALPGTSLTEATLRLGASYIYAASRAVDVGLGIGLTRDAPDFNFSVSFPFRRSLLPEKARRPQ
jgi:hypothetical protein